MARERGLRMSFTALTAADNVDALKTLGTQGAFILSTDTTFRYQFAYSDPLNLNRFSSTFADAANFSAQANTPTDSTAAPLGSSTSDAAYYIRASVAQSPFCSGRPFTITAQAASSTDGTAPSQTTADWNNCGSTVHFPATGTYATLTTDATGVTANAPAPGSIIRCQTAAGGLLASSFYLMASETKVIQVTGGTIGGLLTTSAGSPAVVYNSDSATATITVTAYNSTTGEFTSTGNVEIGDIFIFTTYNGTGYTAVSASASTYFVSQKTSNGFMLATSYGGATVTGGTLTSTSTGFGFKYYKSGLLNVANGTSITTLASRVLGVSVPHNLSVGDVLMFMAGTLNGNSWSVANMVSVIVKSIVSATEFTVCNSLGGDAVAVTVSNVYFAPARNPKLVPIQIDKTSRQWIRLCSQHMNPSTASQYGHIAILYADVCPGKDGSYVLR